MTKHPCLQTLFRLLACSVAALFASAAMSAAGTAPESRCPEVHIDVERLPDLNVARACHALFYANGEVVVAGGHTDGFVPTPTAEYFADGEWHLMDMVYTADFSLCQVLSSGKVLLAGGMAENLGIGQQWTMQTYDPATHTFTGFGCLDKKRSWPAGGMVDNGRVLISGNWYGSDAIGCYRGGWEVDSVKPVTQERKNPFIVRTSPDNAIIFGWVNTRGIEYDSIWADRFHGEPFRVPLLDEWRQLWPVGTDHRMMDSFVGDTVTGDFTYLLPVQNKAGEVAIMKIRGEEFSLLPTAQPVPAQGNNGDIYYFDCIVVDRHQQCAYLAGLDVRHVLYVLRIDKPASGWNDGEAQLTLFYTDPLPEPIQCIPVLTDEGDLVFAGGAVVASDTAFHTNNFNLNKAAYRLPIGTPEAASKAGIAAWWWLLVAAIVAYGAYRAYKAHKPHKAHKPYEAHSPHSPQDSPASPEPDESQLPLSPELEALMQRICEVMESQQLFLQSDLKLSDFAALMGESRNTISNALRYVRHSTFPDFVNEYRVEFSKQLLRQQPDAKLATLCLEAGFANETSFFRTFKKITGQTPSEWRAENL